MSASVRTTRDSGHIIYGFLDLAAYENYLAGRLEDLDLDQGKIDAALGDLPKA